MYPASPAQFFWPFNLNWPILSIRWTQSRFILNVPITTVHSHTVAPPIAKATPTAVIWHLKAPQPHRSSTGTVTPYQPSPSLDPDLPCYALQYSMDHKSTYKRFHKFLLKQQWFWDIIHKRHLMNYLGFRKTTAQINLNPPLSHSSSSHDPVLIHHWSIPDIIQIWQRQATSSP